VKVNNKNCFKKLIAINGISEDVWKVLKDTKNHSPNLSPIRREALKPPFTCREGTAHGVRF